MKIYRILMKKIIFTCFFVLVSMSIMLAQNTVNGKVVDKHGKPIPGVKVETADGKYSILSGLDGMFTLPTSRAYGDVDAFYVGFKPVSTRLHDNMTIVMKRETWWNREPDKRDWFILFQTGVRMDAFGTSTAPSLGIMFGQVKHWGWYIRALTWLNGSYSNDKISYVDSNGEIIDPEYWWTTGRSKRNHSVFSVGTIARLGCALHLYFGVGIALTQDMCELADGSWMRMPSKIIPNDIGMVSSIRGAYVGDIGFMLKMDIVAVNIGITYLGDVDYPSPVLKSNWTLNAGVGFNF